MDLNPLYFLSAPRGAGKTTFCAHLTSLARTAGWEVAGLLSPARFEAGEKTGILARNLRTDETRTLAVVAPAQATTAATFCYPLGQWLFDPSVFDWGNLILANNQPCDLFILDELGPLELLHGRGWHTALNVLRQAAYRTGLVVIRPELLETALLLFPQARVVNLQPAEAKSQAAQWFRQVAQV